MATQDGGVIQQRPARWRQAIDLAASVAIIVAAGVVVWTALHRNAGGEPKPLALPASPIELQEAELRGDRHAPVAMIEYSDFQCPFCRQFAQTTLPALEKAYVQSGKLLLAFKADPLPIHPMAAIAAEAASCAASQGKFWAFHDWLFKNPTRVDTGQFDADLPALAIDSEKFETCLKSDDRSTWAQARVADASALGVRATPTFFIGRLQADGRVKIAQAIEGAQPLLVFQKAIDRLIATGS